MTITHQHLASEGFFSRCAGNALLKGLAKQLKVPFPTKVNRKKAFRGLCARRDD